MSHIGERIADYVFEELSASEIVEAKRHLAQCSDCCAQVEQFQRTHAMLKVLPDVDPPRSIVFEFEKPPVSRLWRWLVPAAAAISLFIIAIVLAGNIHVQWRDSQLTIAFGQIITPAETDQAALAMEIQRLQGQLAYLEDRQQKIERDSVATASTISLLAQSRARSGD